MVRPQDPHESDPRSERRCPRCGEHRLALLEFPRIAALPYQPHSELIGMGQPSHGTTPGIGCLACGAEWASLTTFEREAAGELPAGERDEAIDRRQDSPPST
jgi:hypothetical protein